jgi:alpha-tubulin suppressor-like RCC1 family protein
VAEFDGNDLFEQRLATRLAEFGNAAVRPYDAAHIAGLAAASGGRGWRSRLPALPAGGRALLAAALLAVGIVGVGIVGGFIKLPTDNTIVPDPSFQPFSPLPTNPDATAIAGLSPSPLGSASALPSGLETAQPSPSTTLEPTPNLQPTPSDPPTAQPTPSPVPTASPTPGPEPVNAVVAATLGDSHGCAVADDGRVFCWGSNESGQLGDGTQDYRDFGTEQVIGIDDATGVAAGIRFSCAVRTGGSVWCWGEDPGSDEVSSVPFQVAGISDATAVTAGGAFACALRENRHVACWGINSLGQLGNGQIQHDSGVSTPQAVVGIDDALALSAGWNHACVVRVDRSVWCWGGNGDGATGYGQLGDGTFENRPSPVQVVGIDDALVLDAGGWTTCAVRVDGSAWCWGYGEQGTLGDGNSVNSATPVQVSGIDDARTVSVGRFKACAIRADSSTWCWGATSWGSSTGGPAPTPVEGNSGGLEDPVALAADRQLIVLDGDGAVWNWGGGTNQAPDPWPIGP